MSLDKVILGQQTKVNIALETLATNRQYSEDKSIYGLKRVDWYIEDVEGDWLEQWPESTSVSQEVSVSAGVATDSLVHR